MSRAEGYIPTMTWCDQGHVMPVAAPVCPTCWNTVAVITSNLLEQLHLGFLPALDPDSLIGRTHVQFEILHLQAGESHL